MYRERFTDYLQSEERLSQHTVIAYNSDLAEFLTFVSKEFSIKDPAEIHRNIVRTWIMSLISAKYSNSSVNRKTSALKTYFKFLQREGLMKRILVMV
jgi:integrase/recombinase XerC